MTLIYTATQVSVAAHQNGNMKSKDRGSIKFERKAPEYNDEPQSHAAL